MNADPTIRKPAMVTILIPLFNGGRFIRETLDSILAQSHSAFEVIVVDDGSTDDGPDIVRTFLSDTRCSLVMKPHLGIALTRNTAARLADEDSDYLVFMDQDDLWDGDLLTTLVERLDQRPDATAAFALADFVDISGRVVHEGAFSGYMRTREEYSGGRLVARAAEADVNLEQVFLTNPVYPPSCVLVRRGVYESVGGFDPSYRVADDWDFVMRLARRGPIVPVDRVMVGYRRHDANASGDTPLNVRETRRVWSTAYHSRENSADQARQLRAVWRAHQRRASTRKLAEGRELITDGRVGAGLARAADGLAHRLLCSPLRAWAGAAGPAAHPDGEVPVSVERGDSAPTSRSKHRS